MLPLNGVCLSFQCEGIAGERSWCMCTSEYPCKFVGDKLQCNCGEEWKIYEWAWEEDQTVNNVRLSNDNRDVVFHPSYSSGTAVVRGTQRLKQNLHYYWEIKILSNLYGTDIMVGIGTPRVVLSDWKLRFSSMLGYDRESWGFSYRGNIQHARKRYKYGPRFSIGSLIGMHVDMCAGTLEYYLNRKPLGVAFHGLKNEELYPMACSTAAQSAMRITCSISELPTLQMECLKVINNNAKLLQQYWDIPGLARIIGQKYFWMAPTPSEEAAALDLEDEVVLPTQFLDRNFFKGKRFCSLFQFDDSSAHPQACRCGPEIMGCCSTKQIKKKGVDRCRSADQQQDINIYEEEDILDVE